MEQPACPLRASVIACEGHALVIGGPGSGKTTVALRKALVRIRSGLRPGQTVLFLSFSRAAVTRVFDAAKLEVPKVELELLSIQTFHSFFWDLLKAHAYLIGAPRRLSILLPHDEKALSGGVAEGDEGWDEWKAERERLFWENGRIAFDLFASNTAEILSKSSLVLSNIATSYPLIIVDEAQDTGDNAWRCIELLSSRAQIVCLADLEQQIFDFLPGVGPERVLAIRSALKPLDVDLGSENHRSPDSEILAFANDILSARPRGAPYQGVAAIKYSVRDKDMNWNHFLRRALHELHRAVRTHANSSAKSVAILTSSKSSALKISNALNALGAKNQGKAVRHKLFFDEAEAMLSARFAAFFLEPKDSQNLENDVATCMELLAAAKRATGTGKGHVAKLLEQASKIRNGKELTVNIAVALRSVLSRRQLDSFTGNPAADWLAVKYWLRDSGQPELTRVASQLDYLVAFQRGTRISAGLAAEWSRDGAYTRARHTLDAAFTQELILDGVDIPNRIQVMNIHKAKGKQFDGVILLREPNYGEVVTSSFVWFGDEAPYVKSRRLLRVGATRARMGLLILDPVWPNCPLLRGHIL